VSARVWYFAYGSNMQRATFSGRRAIECSRVLAGRLTGWRLVFDKPPLAPIGESFANVVPDPGAEVLGALYEIAADDLAHIDLTEGVLIDNYRRIEVAVTSLDGTLRLDAFTLTSDKHAPELRPSTRYMACVIAGAQEIGLPPAWIDELRIVPAGPQSRMAAALRPVMDAVMKKGPARSG
jgi:gamma-glutamylcyclotransferase (GGCT)/AIG2-like uncharacterized protein YtfP